MCSWGDTLNAEKEEHRLNTADRIRDQLLQWKDTYQMAALVWRQERWLAEMAKIDPRVSEFEPSVYRPLYEVDDAQVATEAAKAAGVKIFCYVDLYDEGQPPHVDAYTHGWFPWESKFFAKHPEYYACDRVWEKRHWGVPEYCYPEVREYKCREELATLVERYDWDGVFISTRGHRMAADHGDQYGFNEPVALAFKERYGVDILTENFDLEAWRRLRGEGITQYLRDVRELCDEHNLSFGIGIPPGDHFGPPIGNIAVAVDIHHGVVESPGVAAFGESQRNPRAGLSGGFAHWRELIAVQIDGLIQKSLVEVVVLQRFAPHPIRIPRNERLREHHQIRAVGRRLGNLFSYQFNGCVAVQVDRGFLDRRDLEVRFPIHCAPAIPPSG